MSKNRKNYIKRVDRKKGYKNLFDISMRFYSLYFILNPEKSIVYLYRYNFRH